MKLFQWPNATRDQVLMAGLHIGMLVVALAVAWQKDGPPADKAFWAILTYFAEIAVAGVVELSRAALNGRGIDRNPE